MALARWAYRRPALRESGRRGRNAECSRLGPLESGLEKSQACASSMFARRRECVFPSHESESPDAVGCCVLLHVG